MLIEREKTPVDYCNTCQFHWKLCFAYNIPIPTDPNHYLKDTWTIAIQFWSAYIFGNSCYVFCWCLYRQVHRLNKDLFEWHWCASITNLLKVGHWYMSPHLKRRMVIKIIIIDFSMELADTSKKCMFIWDDKLNY